MIIISKYQILRPRFSKTFYHISFSNNFLLYIFKHLCKLVYGYMIRTVDKFLPLSSHFCMWFSCIYKKKTKIVLKFNMNAWSLFRLKCVFDLVCFVIELSTSLSFRYMAIIYSGIWPSWFVATHLNIKQCSILWQSTQNQI